MGTQYIALTFCKAYIEFETNETDLICIGAKTTPPS